MKKKFTVISDCIIIHLWQVKNNEKKHIIKIWNTENPKFFFKKSDQTKNFFS